MVMSVPTRLEANSHVLAIQGAKMEVNHLANLRLIAESGGVKDWRGKFQGIPAIVIGAGPSLTEAIPQLGALRERALLVATDRSLKPLLAGGVVPHVVVSADMDPELALLYDGFAIPRDVVLVYDRDAFHGLIKTWPHRKVTYDSYFESGIWSRMFTGAKGFLGKNGSVGHTAWYFASACGCEPIILVGVDCAMPGESTHAEGVAQVDGGKVDPAHPSWLTIEGVDGKPVRSSPGFARYAQAFGEMIHAQRRATVNCSQIGAKIDGAYQMPLEQVAREHLGMEYHLDALVNRIMRAPVEGFNAALFARHMEIILPGLEKLAGLCDRGMKILGEAHRINHKTQPIRFRGKLLEADKVRERMNFSDFLQKLMWKTLYKAVYLMGKLDGEVKGLGAMHPKMLWTQAARLEVLFKVEKEGALGWKKCLEGILEQCRTV